jgi:hypothetical protein
MTDQDHVKNAGSQHESAHQATTMRYPDNTPMVFAGAKRFVESHGMQVWCELCDEVLPGEWFQVSGVASKLPSLQGYRQPERYLRAILKAVLADFDQRPDAYEGQAPVKVRGRRLDVAMV